MALLWAPLSRAALLDCSGPSRIFEFWHCSRRGADGGPEDTAFWIDNGIGKRRCEWLKGLYAVSPTTFAPVTPLRGATDKILSDMVRVGVAEASQLEVTLCA